MSASAAPDSLSVPLPFQGAERHIRALTLLNEAARTINSILDLEVLLDKIVNQVASAFDCSISGISLKEPETGDLVCVASQVGVEGKGARFRVGVDGITGHVASTGRVHYAPDVSKDPYYLMCARETRSEVGIPLKVGGELIGVLSAQHADLDGFCEDKIKVLEVLAEHIAIAVQNAQLFERERAENKQFYWEQQEAAAIQQALFPKAAPRMPGLSVEGRCITARAVGGDWFDYIPIADGRCAFVLADVAGKGMPAALLMTSSRAILRSLVETTPDPAQLLTRLNRVLRSDLPDGKFVTMLYAVFDPTTRLLTFANAGHPWPIYVHHDQLHFLTTALGLPLGIAESEYDESTIEIGPDSRLLFYTDGITEAQNETGDQFGIEHLTESARDPNVCLNSVLESVCRFAKCRPLADDLTLILLKGTG